MLNQKFSKASTRGAVILCCTLAILTVIIIVNKQYIVDQIAVWKYHPTAEITNLVDRAGMNDSGKFIYYASQPKLDATQSFNTECDRVENITSILGCFSNGMIFIYDITDTQLDGIREVTAVHETLHAIYERMSDSDKTKVDVLLEAEYKKLETDKNFQDRIAFYAKTEPGQRDNELHSIIGTEVANISPELEIYYKKYFTDRQKVVALDTKYSAVFKALEDRAKALADQLNALAAEITSLSDQYNTEVKTLNADIASFNKRASSGDFLSQSQFNSERLALTKRIADLEALKNSINAKMDQYNTLLNEYNSIASQTKKLQNSIDSTLAPAPSI